MMRALVLVMVLAGCATPVREFTVQYHDGRVEVVRETDAAAMRAQLEALESAVALYRGLAEWSGERDRADYERRAEERAARAAELRQVLEALGR
jgi:hypothetical protein